MSYISPRISIVDGTHLCLLPSFNAVSNVSGGGSKSEKNQQTYVANYDMHHTNVEGQAINIPAVPLSSICNIYSGECIPCSDVDTAGNTNIDTMRPQISASSSADKNNLHKLPIETIQIHTSDISNTQYRFIHSTSLNNNNDSTASNLPLRVVVCGVSDEGIISVNNKRVKVTLPSFTTSNEHLVTQYGNEDDCKVYGGENYNIVDGDVANGMQGGNSNNKSRQSIEVQGAGSCLVADFLGIVGYEQALVLPQVSSELLSKQGSTNMNDVESIQQQKELLQMILRHSFLTDGNGILFPKSYASNKTNLTTTKADDDKSMILLTMLPLERLEEDEIAVDEEGSPNDGGSDLMTKEGDASAQHPTKSITIDTQPTDTCNNISSQEDPEWLKLIAQTVEHRLSKQQEESNQIERSAQARIDLVNQGRRTLHAANRPMNHSAKCIDWNNDPMVFRLRYGVRPRTSNHGGGGISVVMDLELDILMPYGGGSEQGTTNSSSSITNTVHDFHISCSLTSNNMKNNQSTTTPENIRTSSGVVPTLQSGDCITMLASICLEDLKISMNDDDNSTLDISIQGLWLTMPPPLPLAIQHDEEQCLYTSFTNRFTLLITTNVIISTTVWWTMDTTRD